MSWTYILHYIIIVLNILDRLSDRPNRNMFGFEFGFFLGLPFSKFSFEEVASSSLCLGDSTNRLVHQFQSLKFGKFVFDPTLIRAGSSKSKLAKISELRNK